MKTGSKIDVNVFEEFKMCSRFLSRISLFEIELKGVFLPLRCFLQGQGPCPESCLVFPNYLLCEPGTQAARPLAMFRDPSYNLQDQNSIEPI